MSAHASAPQFLVLFGNPLEREASCFGNGDNAWLDRTDEGPVRFESVIVGRERPSESPMLAVALLLVPGQLEPPLAGEVAALLDRYRRDGSAIDLMAGGSAMEAIAWINRHLPRLGDCLRADGEVRPDLPSFWRRWAESRLAARRAPVPPPRPRSATDQEGSGFFSLDAIKQFLVDRR